MYQIEITPDRLNRFPKTVPMNIREAVLVATQALNRIRASKAAKKAMASNKDEQKVVTALIPVQEVKVPAPAKRRGPHAEIIFEKSRSPKKVLS